MAIREYKDLILYTDPGGVVRGEHGELRSFRMRVFDSPVGQGEEEDRVTVPENLAVECGVLEGRQLDQDIKRQIALGISLGDMLLPPYARGLYERSLAALREGEGLRLRLRLADCLADLPWEYAYIQSHHGEYLDADFLALNPRVSIVRHEAVSLPGDWFQAPGKRRIVLAMASPLGLDPLRNLGLEQLAIKAELDKVTGIEVQYLPRLYTEREADEAARGSQRLPGVTAQQLQNALLERADVLHFSGHGEFSREPGRVLDSIVGEGSLILATEKNEPDRLPAKWLAEMLQARGVRLVVLGSCDTGRRDGQNVWSGVVASLMRAGVGAVVAMQYRVNTVLAASFMGAFYRALVAGYLIDEAVALGRSAMRLTARRADGLNKPHMRDWGVPVLYLRTLGGRVFNPVSDPQARQEAEQALVSVRQEAEVLAESGVMVGALNVRSERLRVEQKVREELRGLLIGGLWYEQPPGQAKIVQKMGTVGGVAVGAAQGTPGEVADALAALRGALGGAPAPAATGGGQPAETTGTAAAGSTGTVAMPPGASPCPGCGQPVYPEYVVCAFCGRRLRDGS